MNKKSILVFLTIVMAFSACSVNVLAIGISPSKVELDFEPGLEKRLGFAVFSPIDKDIWVDIYVRGELSEYFSLEKTKFFIPKSNSVSVFTDMKLPEELEKAGLFDVRVGAVEGLPEGHEAGHTIVARTGVESRVLIRVPYPEKYIEAIWSLGSALVGEKANFEIRVSNYGTEVIDHLYAEVEIFDANMNHVTTVKTDDHYNFKQKESVTLTAEWDTYGQRAGKYFGEATIYYDGNKKKYEGFFFVGDLLAEIIEIRFNDTVEGEIGKIEIDVQSMWNEKIEDVYAEATLEKEGKEYGDFRSPSVILKPYKIETLSLYIDTLGMTAGDYNLKVAVYYKDKLAYKTAIFRILEQPVVDWNMIIIVSLAFVVVIMVILYIRRRAGRSYQTRLPVKSTKTIKQ